MCKYNTIVKFTQTFNQLIQLSICYYCKPQLIAVNIQNTICFEKI